MDDYFARWLATNKSSVRKELQKSKRSREKLSLEECFYLKLWANMSNNDWNELRAALLEFGVKGLYTAKHIHNQIGKQIKQDIIDQLNVQELPNTSGGAFVSLRKAIVWILVLFCPNFKQLDSSWWKLMLDGRPKGSLPVQQ